MNRVTFSLVFLVVTVTVLTPGSTLETLEGPTCNKCSPPKCDLACEEQCFTNVPNNRYYKAAYLQIYSMVMGIKNLYAPCFKPKGTAIMIDSEVPVGHYIGIKTSNMHATLLNLASIVAQMTHADDNPIAVIKYFDKTAYFEPDFLCPARNDIYSLFQTPSMKQHLLNSNWHGSPSWVGGAQILADLFLTNQLGGGCSNCTDNPLLIAFSNSPMSWIPPAPMCGSKYYCASVGINPANSENMRLWTNSGPVFHLLGKYYLYLSARNINYCLKRCSSQSNNNNNWLKYTFPLRRRELELDEMDIAKRVAKDEVDIEYIEVEDITKLKHFHGSLKNFTDNILIPIEEKETGNANYKLYFGKTVLQTNIKK